MTPSDLGHAAAWLKALSHKTSLRLRIPPPPTAGPRDDLDAPKRVTASFMNRRTPILIAILTTIGSHRSLAQNTREAHHPGSAERMAGGVTMTLTWKLPASQRERIQMVLLRESGMTQ